MLVCDENTRVDVPAVRVGTYPESRVGDIRASPDAFCAKNWGREKRGLALCGPRPPLWGPGRGSKAGSATLFHQYLAKDPTPIAKALI